MLNLWNIVKRFMPKGEQRKQVNKLMQLVNGVSLMKTGEKVPLDVVFEVKGKTVRLKGELVVE
jgi:hypothetical protein